MATENFDQTGRRRDNPLGGGVFGCDDDDLTDLRNLVDDIGGRAFDAAIGRRSLPDRFDSTAWHHLEEAGLTRLSSTADSGGGPVEAAVVLRALAHHAVTVPVAETDLLAAWLAGAAGLAVPDDGPLTLGIGSPGRPFTSVPYAATAAALVLAERSGDGLRVAVRTPAEVTIDTGHNAGGEPRDTVTADLAETGTFTDTARVDAGTATELVRRGAWARCVQVIGALDAAVEYSVAHTRDREQFGRPLSAFQAVQHALAGMAGEAERARAAANLAVDAVAEHGFGDPRADYAITVAKVTLGRVVPTVITAAHQLHGAIGVTIEHRLWLATQRARCWIGEFGDTTDYARKLGRMALAGDPWELIVEGRR